MIALENIKALCLWSFDNKNSNSILMIFLNGINGIAQAPVLNQI